MSRLLTFVAVLLLPLSLLAMRSLSDSDLSNIHNPLSLSINPEQAMEINESTVTWSASGSISNILLNSINLKSSFNIYLNEDGGDATEMQAPTGRFHFIYVSWRNNDNYANIHDFLIDPKDKTTIASAEDNTGPNYIKVTPVQAMYSIEYPNGLTASSNSAYRYIIKSGDIEMRDTYINETKSAINSGSWVDIKTR
jgi:hypothetical protein